MVQNLRGMGCIFIPLWYYIASFCVQIGSPFTQDGHLFLSFFIPRGDITHNFFAHAQKVVRVSPSAQSFSLSKMAAFRFLNNPKLEFRMAQLFNLFASLRLCGV